MNKKVFQIISAVTTALATAGVAVVNILAVPNAALISGIIVAVSGCIDEACTLFIKNENKELAA